MIYLLHIYIYINIYMIYLDIPGIPTIESGVLSAWCEHCAVVVTPGKQV